MKKLALIKYFSKFEISLWVTSVFAICISFFAVKSTNYLTLTASLIGATALIFLSKGNVIGQILTVIFSILYGIISFTFQYYGEMITYLGMTLPIAFVSVFVWLKNMTGKNFEVKVNHISIIEYIFMIILGVGITIGFYFILKALNTNNLIFSTISIFTSFTASYLSLRRSEYYAIAYALNDIVLIILWVLATIENINYICMIICFVVFLVNDLYGFINWSKIKSRQKKEKEALNCV